MPIWPWWEIHSSEEYHDNTNETKNDKYLKDEYLTKFSLNKELETLLRQWKITEWSYHYMKMKIDEWGESNYRELHGFIKRNSVDKKNKPKQYKNSITLAKKEAKDKSEKWYWIELEEVQNMKTFSDIQKIADKLYINSKKLNFWWWKWKQSMLELYYDAFQDWISKICEEYIKNHKWNWYFISRPEWLMFHDTITKKEILIIPKDKLHFNPIDLIISWKESCMRTWWMLGNDSKRASRDVLEIAIGTDKENLRRIKIIDEELSKNPSAKRKEYLLLQKKDALMHKAKINFLESWKKDVPRLVSDFKEILELIRINKMPKFHFYELDNEFQNHQIPQLNILFSDAPKNPQKNILKK
ncbi:MAG: hypothetical protein ACD_3C00099G0004 [uncultured bacterium (gcode 4)]|uniref:Uncharacterized protein n=1 Tax=uncultured bacterium (gcode 4) TaxID=1234023 RepID=K2GXJ0_9BACT|nr:MAG: hypothetical protein ACD_3C00099G0004 [uncultured bacterium (gcode 4)]